MRNVGGLTLDAYVRAYLPPFGVLRTDRFNDVTRRPPNFLFVCFAFFTPSLYLVLSRAVRFIALEPSILPTRRTNLRRRIEKAYVRRFAEFSICCRSTRECAGCVSCTRTWVPTYWLHRLRGFVGKRGPEKVYRIGKRMKVEVQEMGKKKEREREGEREGERERGKVTGKDRNVAWMEGVHNNIEGATGFSVFRCSFQEWEPSSTRIQVLSLCNTS